jgi:hypothetical protein
MIETYKRRDGEALGAKKVGEGSGESDIPEPPKTHHKNAFVPKPNHLRNRLDKTPAPPVFLPQTNNFQEPIMFKSVLGNEFFVKKGEKLSEEKPSEEKPEPKGTQNKSQNQNPSIVSIVGGMGTLLSFASGGSVRRGCLESSPTRTGTALLVVCLSLDWCREVRVWRVPFTPERGVSLCLEVSHHIENVVSVLRSGFVSLLDVPLLVANTSMEGTIAVLGPRGATGHGLPFVVRVVLQGDMWVFHLGEIAWILLTPHLSKWRGTGLIPFVLTQVLSLFSLSLLFWILQVGGMEGFWLITPVALDR